MSQSLLMPKATAVWLVDNTALSFEQIAAFCTLHPLEVQGIADGDVASGTSATLAARRTKTASRRLFSIPPAAAF